jgi:hypothetical protein
VHDNIEAFHVGLGEVIGTSVEEQNHPLKNALCALSGIGFPPLEATKFRVSCPLPGKKDRPEAMHIGLDAIITGRKPILHLYQDL